VQATAGRRFRLAADRRRHWRAHQQRRRRDHAHGDRRFHGPRRRQRIAATQNAAAGANVSICGDTITLDDPLDAGVGTARLAAAGDVSATAVITAAALGVLSSSGDIDVDNVANTVATFAPRR